MRLPTRSRNSLLRQALRTKITASSCDRYIVLNLGVFWAFIPLFSPFMFQSCPDYGKNMT